MSTWIDLENTDYVISTGDGKVFTPYWFKAKRRWEYCIAKFEFYKVQGSLVKRGQPRGVEYLLDIVFEGADHLAQAEEFRKSADNPAPWTVTHPHYGSIVVQPISLEQDNTDGNLSRFTGTVIETYKEDTLKLSNKSIDAIPVAAEATRISLNDRLEADLVTPPATSFLTRLRANMAASKAFLLGKISAVQDYADQVNNYYATANSLINQSVFDTADVAGACTGLLALPAGFDDSVANRLAQLEGLADILNADVDRILAFHGSLAEALQQKLQYEHNMGVVVTGICETLVTNITTDYDYRPAVLEVIARLLSAYDTYLANINVLQSLNGGILHAFVPGAQALTDLHALVYNTIDYLFDATANALQQRTYVVPYDDNMILLANRLYPDDPDIEGATLRLKTHNGMGLNEILVVPKGRKLIYYV